MTRPHMCQICLYDVYPCSLDAEGRVVSGVHRAKLI